MIWLLQIRDWRQYCNGSVVFSSSNKLHDFGTYSSYYSLGIIISVYEKPDRASLIKALSVGYLLNYILPFKLGDLVKAYLAGRKMKSGRALGLSTVIVDRFFDIVCVGLIFAGLAVNKHGGVWSKVSVYVILAGGLLLAALVIFSVEIILKKW